MPKHEQRRFLAGHRVKGGVVRLSDDADVCLRLGLSEGTETALAIQTSFARAGRSEIVWAAVNAGNMAELPVVAGIETLVVYADKDAGGAGQRAAQELAARWTRAGREAYIALPDSRRLERARCSMKRHGIHSVEDIEAATVRCGAACR